MTPEQRAQEACAKLIVDWGHEGSWQAGYVQGWADSAGVVALQPGRTIRLIPPGTTHMQYGASRRMAIADYLTSPHYDAPGWVPVRRQPLEHDAPAWLHWTREGWK